MREGYVLERLDTLISITLNPEKTNVALLNNQEIATLENFIDDEKNKAILAIKNLVFNMGNSDKIKSAIKLYYSSLIVLLDHALKNQHQNLKHPQLKQVSEKLIECVNDILFLIKCRFADYLGSHERLPKTYFDCVKEELLAKISKIKKKLNDFPECKPTSELMIHVLINFLNLSTTENSVTFKEIKYIKEMCFEIDRIEYSEWNETFSMLDVLLICLNFNSSLYRESLIQRLKNEINRFEKKEDKIDCLLTHFKVINQLPKKSDAVFNSRQPDLIKFLSNWFHFEIEYLQKNIHLSANSINFNKRKVSDDTSRQKVICSLSTDQTGLIIRAADELKILIAKSMSEVFKTIVPHLSTQNKKDLSYDGMRSKSYVAEERDKQIAIKTLQEIIKKIQGY